VFTSPCGFSFRLASGRDTGPLLPDTDAHIEGSGLIWEGSFLNRWALMREPGKDAMEGIKVKYQPA